MQKSMREFCVSEMSIGVSLQLDHVTCSPLGDAEMWQTNPAQF